MDTKNAMKLLEAYKKEIDPDVDLEYYKKLLKHIESDIIGFGRRIVQDDKLGETRKYKMLYLAVILSIMKGEFIHLNDFLKRINAPEWIKKGLYNYLKTYKPEVHKRLIKYDKNVKEKLAQAVKRMVENGELDEEYALGLLDEKFYMMAEVATKFLDIKDLMMQTLNEKIPEVVEHYATEMAIDMTKSVKQLVAEQMDAIKEDLVKTRMLMIQNAQLAIIGYYNGLRDRAAKGKVSYQEAQKAYEILKIELGEPTTIKEQHDKQLKVVINVDANPDDNIQNTDLDLEIAPQFKELVEKKLQDVNTEDINQLVEEKEKEIDNFIDLDLNTNEINQGTDKEQTIDGITT